MKGQIPLGVTPDAVRESHDAYLPLDKVIQYNKTMELANYNFKLINNEETLTVQAHRAIFEKKTAKINIAVYILFGAMSLLSYCKIIKR